VQLLPKNKLKQSKFLEEYLRKIKKALVTNSAFFIS
jgi:hypothetical protein